MFSMNKFGNDLYTGKVSVPFVRRRRLWFFIAIALVLGAVAVLLIKPPQFSIEFTGGSQFTVSGVEAPDQLVAGDTVMTLSVYRPTRCLRRRLAKLPRLSLMLTRWIPPRSRPRSSARPGVRT